MTGVQTCALPIYWLRAMLLTAVAALALHSPAQGQSYPERAVRIINPFPAGGSGDAVLRVVFEKVGAALGQSFVAEARTGASGSIGTDFGISLAISGAIFSPMASPIALPNRSM